MKDNITIPVNIRRSISLILYRNKDSFYCELGNTKIKFNATISDSMNEKYSTFIADLMIIDNNIKSKLH